VGVLKLCYTIAGDRTVRWARSRHAAKQGPSLGEHAQRSPPNLCSEDYTTFTALLHDKFLRPTGDFDHEKRSLVVSYHDRCGRRILSMIAAGLGG
jgi:hypothetical protein